MLKVDNVQATFNPLVKTMIDELPANFSKDAALTKIQECVWWSTKAVIDEQAVKEAEKKKEEKKDD